MKSQMKKIFLSAVVIIFCMANMIFAQAYNDDISDDMNDDFFEFIVVEEPVSEDETEVVSESEAVSPEEVVSPEDYEEIEETQELPTEEQKKLIVQMALEDFRNGMIPMYEFDPTNGMITTHGKPVYSVRSFVGKSTEEKKDIIKAQIKKGMVKEIMLSWDPLLDDETLSHLTEICVKAENEDQLRTCCKQTHVVEKQHNLLFNDLKNILFPFPVKSA